MLYEAVLDGLPVSLSRAVAELTASFHDGRPGRTSVFVVTDAAGVSQLTAGRTIELQRGLTPWLSWKRRTRVSGTSSGRPASSCWWPPPASP